MPVAPAPDWLVSALRAAPAPSPAAARTEGGGAVYGRLRGVVAAVIAAKPGARNNTLYWAACRAAEMAAAGQVDEAAAAEALARAGELAGLGPAEIGATIASGLRGVSP